MLKRILAISFSAAVIAAGIFVWNGRADTSRALPIGPLNQAAVEQAASVTTPSVLAAQPSQPPAGSRTFGGAYPKAFSLETQTPPPEGAVQDAWTKLQPLAKSGDADAAFRLYKALDQCQQLALTTDRKVDHAGNAALEETTASLNACDGVTKEQITTMYDWLLKAANAGHVEAQLAYASFGSDSLGSKAEMLANPEATIRFRENAARLLHSAAERGSVDALSILSSYYRKGGIVKADPVLAYAYKYAEGIVMPASGARDVVFSQLSQNLSAAEVEAAKQRGQQIADRCCR